MCGCLAGTVLDWWALGTGCNGIVMQLMEVDVDQLNALELARHSAEDGELCGWLTTAVHIHVLLDHMRLPRPLPFSTCVLQRQAQLWW
jgi:hypothetical protein